ncbi:hypothetical protein LQW54_010641 [Pestalotiopsis sp. IQ-011]
MASKTSIPRFLLPQYGAIWRTTAARTTAPFSRPAARSELGLVLVRYASKTVAASPKTAAAKSTTTASKTAAAKKVEAPKSASTKAAAGKATSVKASPKIAKAPAAAKSPAAAKAATPKLSKTPDPAASRKAVTPDPSKPLVLEKPERFNPPSHGARLPRSTPRHQYGGAPTAEEIQAQKTKDYPGLPPPPTTWSHWFINNRHIHMFITLGTLVSLAAYTFAAKFNATSPYAHMIPAISEFPSHPIDYIGTCFHVLRLHEEHISAVTAEKRRRKVDDVAKRNEYRKAHGLDSAQGIESWIAPAKEAPVAAAAAEVPEPATGAVAEPVQATPEVFEDGKRKKFLGIF